MIGAGVANMKGSLAAQAVATARIAASAEPHASVVFTAVVGECSDLGLGTLTFLKNCGAADFAIVGEPTGLLAQTSHTGTYEARVDFTGVAAHIGDYQWGYNSVETASEFVLAVRDTSSLKQGTGPFEGTPRAMSGRMSGGFYPQIAAPSTSVWTDLRIPPGMDQSDLETFIDAVAARCARSEHSTWKRTTLAYEPAYALVPSAAPFMRHLEKAFETVSGEKLTEGFATPSNRFFATDAAHLAAAGIPSLVFGSGTWITGPDEKVSIAEVCAYAYILIEFAHEAVGS